MDTNRVDDIQCLYNVEHDKNEQPDPHWEEELEPDEYEFYPSQKDTEIARTMGVEAELVTEAKRAELRQLAQMGTFSVTQTQEVNRYSDATIVGTKWVIVNKGSQQQPQIKARLCAQEFAIRPDAELFAGTPGLAGVRCILSHFASGDRDMHLAVADVKGAFLYGRLDRHAYIRLPTELTNGQALLGRLHKSLYGLRDAPKVWRRTLGQQLLKYGMQESPTIPGMWRKLDSKLVLGVHVDDLMLVGPRAAIEDVLGHLRRAFELK